MNKKRNVFYSLLVILAGVIYFPAQAQQKNGAQDVVHQLDIKKSKLFWKAPKNQHHGFILFNSGTLSNFIAGRPTRGTFSSRKRHPGTSFLVSKTTWLMMKSP